MRVLGKEVIALGTAMPAIESAWSPKPGFHTLERETYREKSGADHRHHEGVKRCRQLHRCETQIIANNLEKTTSLEAIRRFVYAQTQTLAARWQVAYQNDREPILLVHVLVCSIPELRRLRFIEIDITNCVTLLSCK